jgi:uncharacterized membrane protein YeaQ/YmgE (transglycosylase-associated protein family)
MGILPNRDSTGWILTVGLGIVGCLIGGFLMNAVMRNDTVSTGFQPKAIIGSVIGALVVLGIFHWPRHRAA